MELPAHIKLVFVDTPEKFQPLAADIVPPLIGLLGDLCALEEKFYARDQAQKASRPGGIYATQAHPNSTALWERYREAYTALLDPRCTEKLLARRRGCCQSMGDPADFACLKGGAEILFTMKSRSKAVVIVRAFDGFGSDCRFELKPEAGAWSIDKVSQNTCGDGPWRTDFYF